MSVTSRVDPWATRSTKPIHVLIVEDDDAGRRSIERFLRDSGFEVTSAADAEIAERLLDEHPFSVVVTDYRLPGIDGIELVRRVKARNPALPCLVVTAHGDVRSAVEAMRAGATQFLEKPAPPELLIELIREAWEKHALRLEVEQLRRQLDDRYGVDQLIGSTPAMCKIFERIKLAAPTTSTVLITGESGTGKELVARAIHQNSLVKHGPFVAVNCGALPETLVESELFGHEKGAFTGAVQAKKGFFEAAEKGTLFIDEIGDLPLTLQPKLLRALEQRVITRVGSTKETPVDVRILAATHQQLERMVRESRFRPDLYFRLSVVTIDLPPLRERKDDVRLLVSALLDRLAAAARSNPCEISPEALDALVQYGWPGNVRELRNVLESMVVLNTERQDRARGHPGSRAPRARSRIARGRAAARSGVHRAHAGGDGARGDPRSARAQRRQPHACGAGPRDRPAHDPAQAPGVRLRLSPLGHREITPARPPEISEARLVKIRGKARPPGDARYRGRHSGSNFSL